MIFRIFAFASLLNVPIIESGGVSFEQLWVDASHGFQLISWPLKEPLIRYLRDTEDLLSNHLSGDCRKALKKFSSDLEDNRFWAIKSELLNI